MTDEGGAEVVDRLDAAVARADWPAVIALLDEGWAELISADPVAVRRAVAGLPEDVRERNPRWAAAREYLDRMVDPRARTTRFRGSAPASAPGGLLDVLAGLTRQAAAARAAGRLDEAAGAVREARALLDEASVPARDQLRQALPELEYQWAMVWEHLGDADEATRGYVESHDNARAVGNEMAAAMAAGSLALMHALSGRNIQARNWLDRLPPDPRWWQARSGVAAHLARTLVLADALRLDEARRELAQVDLERSPERWPYQKLAASMLVTEPAHALELLTQIDGSATAMPEAAMRFGASGVVVALARSVLLAAIGAHREARDALEVPQAPRGSLADQVLTCSRAAADLRAGDHGHAMRLVTPLRTSATSAPRVLVAALVVSAACEARGGDEREALGAFRLAASLAAQHALYRPFLSLTRPDLVALLALDDSALPARIAEELLGRLPEPSPDPFASLTRRELEVVDALLAGRSIAETAADLYVSVNTLKTQLRSIYRKTGVDGRTGLAALAIRHGRGGAAEGTDAPRRATD